MQQTKFFCDNCNVEISNTGQVWEIKVQYKNITTYGSSYSDGFTQHKVQQWCRNCMEKNHILGRLVEVEGQPPAPSPTFAELLEQLIDEKISAATGL